MHVDLAIVPLKMVLLSLEEYGGSRFKSLLARATEIAGKLNV